MNIAGWLVFRNLKNRVIIGELMIVILLFVVAGSYQLLTLQWISILLIGMISLTGIRYGIGYGLISICCGVILYTFYTIQAGNDVVIMLYEPAFTEFCVTALFFGFLSGMFRTQLDERYQDLSYEKEELTQEHEQALSTLNAFREANAQLKRKVVENETNLATIYEITRLLNHEHPEKVLNEAVRIIKDHYGADVFGIYHVDQSEKAWRLKIDKSSRDERMPTSYFSEENSFMFKKVLEKKELYIRSLDNPDDARGPVICAPIFTGNDVKYVLVIRKVDLMRLTLDGLETLKWILRFVADPLLLALNNEQLRLKNTLVPGTPFRTVDFYNDTLSIHQERKERFDQPYTQFSINLIDKPIDLDNVYSLLKVELREMDIVSWDPQANQLLILLPGTNPEYCKFIQTRVSTSLSLGVM